MAAPAKHGRPRKGSADRGQDTVSRPRSAKQSAAAPSPFPPIADFAFLSDCHTGALAAPDGSIDYAAFIGLLHAIGIDRILFSVDYPYSDNRASKRFLENLPISPDDKEKVAHLNAERLLKFKPPR